MTCIKLMKKSREIQPINKESMLGVIGLMIALIAVIAILSPLPEATRWITIGSAYAFGQIGFWVFYIALFVFGIYLMFKRKLMKIRFDITMIGIIVFLIAFLTFFTIVFVEETLDMKLDTFYAVFQANIQSVILNPGSMPYSVETGGGFLGFLLTALFNYATHIGAIILSVAFLMTGVGLILNRQVKKLYLKIKEARLKARAKKAYFQSVKNAKPEKFDDIEFKEAPKPTPVEPVKEVVSVPVRQERPFYNTPRAIPQPEPIREVKQEAPKFEPRVDSKPAVQPSAAQALPPYRPGNGDVAFQVKSFSASQGLRKAKFFLDGDAPAHEPTPAYEPAVKPSAVPEVKPVFEPVLEQSANPLKEEINEAKKPEPELKTTSMNKPIKEENVKPEIKIREYTLPSLDLLDNHESEEDLLKNEESTAARTELINTIFEDLNIGAKVVGHTIGPSVTRYDIQMDRNVSVSSMARYINDISIRLGGVATRFEALVIGKATSGLEIPNEYRTNVGLKEALEKMPTGGRFNRDIPFGKNISGELIYANLGDLPHMLVAGSTGSGKSIFVHTLLMSLIMRNRPDELKLLVVDPKRVELSNYADIPHLICPIITDSRKAKVAFNKLVDEMERRYGVFQEARVSKISQYNDSAKSKGLPLMPYIVVVVDEYADLSDTCRDIHEPVVRIAQKARAAGMHLIISTQRPTADVVNPRIKTNLPAHVALMMSNFTDSTTIIGESGAEKLLGNGDMLVECAIISRTSKPRLQGCFVDLVEINRVAEFIKAQWPAEYDPSFLDLEEKVEEFKAPSGEDLVANKATREMAEEEMYAQLVEDIMLREYTSISYITRTYGVGFPKAGRLFARLQRDGIVATENDASKGCKVLIHDANFNAPSINPGSTELVVEEDK